MSPDEKRSGEKTNKARKCRACKQTAVSSAGAKIPAQMTSCQPSNANEKTPDPFSSPFSSRDLIGLAVRDAVVGVDVGLDLGQPVLDLEGLGQGDFVKGQLDLGHGGARRG